MQFFQFLTHTHTVAVENFENLIPQMSLTKDSVLSAALIDPPVQERSEFSDATSVRVILFVLTKQNEYS